MGRVDRLSRTGLGIALVASAAVGALGGWAYLGLLAIATGLLGRCPVYSMLGYSTLRPSGKD
jgi:hypothetical protein